MPLYGDQCSIAATTAGVTGTIVVPGGVRIVGLNLAATDTAGAILTSIEITSPGIDGTHKYVPNLTTLPATNGAALAACGSPLVPLDIRTKSTCTITIKLTSTANITVACGLMWLNG